MKANLLQANFKINTRNDDGPKALLTAADGTQLLTPTIINH